MDKQEIKTIQAINDLIFNAIIHGADAGGSYDQNEQGLRESIFNLLKVLGIQDCILEYVYRDDWCVIQLVKEKSNND